MATLKKKLKNNQLTIGSWITLADPAIAEIMSRSGFDWLAVDMEHSAITLREAQNLIRIIDLVGCIPLVRVSENNPNIIKRVMDAGAHGVIVPMVNSEKEAVRAVQSVKYPPLGKRGVGLARAQGYGLEFKRYKDWVNKNSIVIVQIEHVDAIDNLEEILSVENIDASIIGPYDLSASLGHPGDFHRKEVTEAINRYMKISLKLKKPAGFHVIQPDKDALEVKRKKGFRFLALSLDTLFLGEKIKEEGIRGKK